MVLLFTLQPLSFTQSYVCARGDRTHTRAHTHTHTHEHHFLNKRFINIWCPLSLQCILSRWRLWKKKRRMIIFAMPLASVHTQRHSCLGPASLWELSRCLVLSQVTQEAVACHQQHSKQTKCNAQLEPQGSLQMSWIYCTVPTILHTTRTTSTLLCASYN